MALVLTISLTEKLNYRSSVAYGGRISGRVSLGVFKMDVSRSSYMLKP
jgi:hypothetical protein